MIEVRGNLWDYKADVHVITTNGSVRKDGQAVMGRGVAKQAASKYPRLPAVLGVMLNSTLGNMVHHFETERIVTFPVKHDWKQQADIMLVMRSLLQLWDLANFRGWRTIAMPRPGCGNGGLYWENVKPLVDVLDDRFVVVNND